MSDAEWEMIMQRLKAVEQAIQEQNDQARGEKRSARRPAWVVVIVGLLTCTRLSLSGVRTVQLRVNMIQALA